MLLREFTLSQRSAQSRPCFFYLPGRPLHCGVHSVRPLICRMFGYAGGRDKFGRPRFAPCPRMLNAACARSVDPAEVPVFQYLRYELMSITPPELSRLCPLSEALAEAVARESLRLSLQAEESGEGGGT